MLFLVGCVEKTSLIPSGTYISSEPNSEEKVEVKGSEIVFHIKINGVFWDRQFSSHSLRSDGMIVFLPISSNEFDFVHRRYNLTFDGKVIWKEDVKTKQKVSFVRSK
jgi:hypothetical protein